MNQNFTLNEFEDFANEVLKRFATIEQQVAKQSKEPADYGQRYLSIEDAAEFLGYKVSTMYAKNKNNEIPYSKIGKVRYRISDLIDYMEAHMIKSNKQIEESLQELLKKPSISKRIY